MIKDVLVLGGGTAGMLAAISLKVRLPELTVKVLRSPSIGVIGVGEGSTPDLLRHLHSYLGINPGEFLREVRPSWKLGIRFEWGDHLSHFNYGFNQPWIKRLHDRRISLGIPLGFYAEQSMNDCDLVTSLMEHGNVFARDARGETIIHTATGYHIENEDFVAWLEKYALRIGISIIDGDCTEIQKGPQGVASLQTKDGQRLRADFYIDASGFRAELIGKVMEEPHLSYADSLFCDRALVGGWDRTDENILPYTVAETMNHGWAWRIDHHDRIHRGYVYATNFTSDDEAEKEFRRKNPKLGNLRIVKFSTGRRRKQWAGNVFAVGNAAGFVEPLEATSLLVICNEIRNLIATLSDCNLSPTESMREACNQYCAEAWDEIRDFLAIHYRFNGRLHTPFWQAARSETALHAASHIVEHYQKNGPSSIVASDLLRPRQAMFGISGYWNLLLGQGVRHARTDMIDEERRINWQNYTAANAEKGRAGVTVKEAFTLISTGNFNWPKGFYGATD